jgi:hypothetical protein
MNCKICGNENCEPDCPIHMYMLRGWDAASVLRWNWTNGNAPIIMADPPYLAESAGEGACEMVRENCEGSDLLFEWNGQNPFSLEYLVAKVCSTCHFELELVRATMQWIEHKS